MYGSGSVPSLCDTEESAAGKPKTPDAVNFPKRGKKTDPMNQAGCGSDKGSPQTAAAISRYVKFVLRIVKPSRGKGGVSTVAAGSMMDIIAWTGDPSLQECP